MSKQKNITIGGLFSIFANQSSELFDKAQLENLYAFLLAIHEVNNRADILPNHHINFVVRTSFPTKTISTISNTKDLIKNTVDGVVGSLDNFHTNIANQYLNDVGIVQSHSMAQGTEFGLKEVFPYKVQTVPIDSYQGMVFQSLFCDELGIKRFVAVLSNDIGGQKFFTETHDDTYCDNLEVPFRLFVDEFVDDFSDFIDLCLATQQTVVMLYLPPHQAAIFLEQAYDKGFLQYGVQVFADHSIIKPEIYKSFRKGAPIEKIMNGIVSIDFWPEYFVYTDNGKKFINAWRNQTDISDCTNKVDASNHKYLFPSNGVKFPSTCVGLNFSQYYKNGTNINPYAPYTYDATYLFLHGLSEQIYNNQTNNNLHSVIINNITFNGATGYIDIFEGMSEFGGYGRGDRESGLSYKVVNFNAAAYRKNINNAFVQVGSWILPEDESNGYKALCSDTASCLDKLTFNSRDGKMPDSLPPYANSKYPEVIKLGGLFNPFNMKGEVDWAQVENMNSFLMAVKHINNKHDGIWDDMLPHSKIVVIINGKGFDFTGGTVAMEELFVGFGESGVHAVVSAMGNQATISSNRVNIPKKVVQIHSVATDSELGDGATYQFKVQTSPIQTYQGMTIQEILCGAPFYVTKISIFASYDYVGSKSVQEISDGTFCSLRMLSIIYVNGLELDDYSSQLNEAKEGGAMYYVFFLPSYTTARIIEQGYEMGVFHSEMQFFGTSLNTNVATVNYFKNKDMMPTYMKGFIGFEWYPDYTFFQDSGKQFMKQWKSMNSTAYEIINGTKQCLKTKDDDGRFLLYQNQTNSSFCTGLDYSSYKSDGSSFISHHVLQTYDATIAIAKGFDLLYKSKQNFSGDALLMEIMLNVSFKGSSGDVEFFEGMPMYGMYGRGDREVGHYYKVLNYDKNSPNAFSFSKMWIVDQGLFDCPSSFGCKPLTFNTANNQPASDTQVDIIVTMDKGVVGALYSLGTLAGNILSQFKSIKYLISISVRISYAGILVLFFLAIIIKYRKTNILKASQLPLLYIVLGGEFFGAIKVLIAASPITTDTCITGLWFAHLGFFMVFTTLMLKSWRVNRLLNNKSLKKLKISTMFMLKLVGGIMLAVIFFLILLTFVGKPHLNYQTTTASNQTTKYPYCAYDYPQFQIFFYVSEILLLFYGVYISWSIKDVPDAINESQYIVAAMGSIAMISYMAFPFIISSPPWIVQLIAGFGFSIAVIGTTLIVFYPKAIVVLTGRDLNMKSMQIEHRTDKHNHKNKITPTVQSNPDSPELVPEHDKSISNSTSADPTTEASAIKRRASATVIGGFNALIRTQPAEKNYDVPTLKDIKGNAQQKVQFIDEKVKEWIKLKQLADQMTLIGGERRNSNSSYNSNSNVGSSYGVSNHESVESTNSNIALIHSHDNV